MKPVFVLNQFGTYYLAFEDMAIHNPRFSICGRFIVSPETYGFYVWGTGGGCTAWRLDGVLESSGKPVYMILTNGDLGHVWEPTDPLEIGVYYEDDNFNFAFGLLPEDEVEIGRAHV